MQTAYLEKATIAIVDDHNLFRKGLIKLISLSNKQKNKYELLFEAESGRELKNKIEEGHIPQIVLLDIEMYDMDGYETAAWLKKNYPHIRVLVISMYKSNESILKMLGLGVKGYLSKDIEVEDMQAALDAISSKGFYYTDHVMGLMARNMDHAETAGKRGGYNSYDLSKNESEFLQLACTELTYNEIAGKMHLSPKTIDGYRESLFQRFHVTSRVSLAMYAVKNGLVTL